MTINIPFHFTFISWGEPCASSQHVSRRCCLSAASIYEDTATDPSSMQATPNSCSARYTSPPCINDDSVIHCVYILAPLSIDQEFVTISVNSTYTCTYTLIVDAFG